MYACTLLHVHCMTFPFWNSIHTHTHTHTLTHTHTHTHTEPYNESAGKGKQMTVGGSKPKTASQDGYFGKSFDRVMEVQ